MITYFYDNVNGQLTKFALGETIVDAHTLKAIGVFDSTYLSS